MFLQVSECQEFTLLVSMEIETIAREPAITIYQKNFNDFINIFIRHTHIFEIRMNINYSTFKKK